MARLIPFRGVRYDKSRVGDLSRVVCPPYDIISPDGQDHFYQLHEDNIIRVELGRKFEEDTSSENRYTRAATYLEKWQQNGVLIRDPQPVFYLYSMGYTLPQGGSRTVKGFLALVKVEEPDTGKVLPHEKTLPKAKQDRLQLLRSCRANTSPIFALYSDAQNKVMAELEKAADQDKPEIDIMDEDGLRHRLWKISDPGVQEAVRGPFEDRPLFIADGHHRYETARNFRNEMRSRSGSQTSEPYDSVLMYCVSMSDPGMSLLPIHRVILNPLSWDQGRIMERLAASFDILPFPFTGGEEGEVLQRFLEELTRLGATKTVFGLYTKGETPFRLLTLKEKPPGSTPLERLDVSLFQKHVLEEEVDLEDSASKKEEQIRFIKDERAAILSVQNGEAAMAFFLNPTRVDELQKVVLSGGLMPPKSTYFYPKPLTGLVLNVFEGT